MKNEYRLYIVKNTHITCLTMLLFLFISGFMRIKLYGFIDTKGLIIICGYPLFGIFLSFILSIFTCKRIKT